MNEEKIHLELKKKTQYQCKNFNQYYCDNFWSQNQNKKHNSHQNFQQDFQQKLCDFWWFFKWDYSRSKNCFFIKKHDYCKENHLCFKCNYSNHSVKNCKFSFNSNQVSVKNDKIKLQSFKTWSRKHTRIQTLYVSNFSNNDKIDHNIYIITDNSEFNSDKSYKHSKN